VPLLGSSGAVDLERVRAVWSLAGTPPPDADIVSTVEWLHGKDRDWKLGPVFRSAPATVGPPPSYYKVPGHSLFEKQYKTREKLIYIASNEGVLHAFRAADGSELFGYVPPHLWPRIHTLWKMGGQSSDTDKLNEAALRAAARRSRSVGVKSASVAAGVAGTQGPRTSSASTGR